MLVLLVGCATQADHNYHLTPEEMKTAGSATITTKGNTATLYSTAQYMSPANKMDKKS